MGHLNFDVCGCKLPTYYYDATKIKHAGFEYAWCAWKPDCSRPLRKIQTPHAPSLHLCAQSYQHHQHQSPAASAASASIVSISRLCASNCHEFPRIPCTRPQTTVPRREILFHLQSPQVMRKLAFFYLMRSFAAAGTCVRACSFCYSDWQTRTKPRTGLTSHSAFIHLATTFIRGRP